MTVSTTTNRIEYTGNGSTDTFAYSFLVLDEDHLEVYLDGVLQTISTHYSVTGVGESAGGDVVFVTAPDTDVLVTILRVVPLTQEVDYQTAGKFPAETHEAALDKLTMGLQQLEERLGRQPSLSVESTFEDLTLPDPVDGSLLQWKSDLSGLQNAALVDLDLSDGTVITTEGDLFQGGTGGVPERLAVGASDDILRVQSGKAAWRDKAYEPVMTAKGDILVATASGTKARRAVGANGTVLTADSAEADGVKWAVPASAAFLLTPEGASFPATNFPQLVKNVGTNQLEYTLDFDQTTAEDARWRIKIPVGVTFTGAEIEIASRQAAATTGTIGWVVTTLARGEDEAWDTAGNADTVTADDVSGTAGQVHLQTKSLTVTGWSAGDVVYVKIARDVASDNVAEDAKLISAVIRLTNS